MERVGAHGVDELLQLSDQLEVVQVHAQLARAGVRVVRRLALVDVVVGTHGRVLALGSSHDLQSAVGNDLVGVHVGGSSSSSLDHIHDELVIELSLNHLVASLADSVHDLLLDESKTTVGNDASLLDHTEGLDEVAVAAQAHAGDVVVVQTTQRLHSVVSVLRDLDLSEKIRLRAELLSVLLPHQTATLNPTTSLRAEE